MNFTVEWHEQLDSTNTHLRERVRVDASLPEGLVVAARAQTGGRGRGAHTWLAMPGENLTFSILLRPHSDATKCLSLPMAAALAVADTLQKMDVAAQLKWPNDVLADGRKICGLLQEYLAGGTVILGIGLNVNMNAENAAQIGQPATSLKIITGKNFDLQTILADVLAAFAPRYSAWQIGGFAALRGAWESRAQPAGEKTSRGIVAGYGKHGELLVLRNGIAEPVWSD